jgi:predicted nucleic acid-binding protein
VICVDASALVDWLLGAPGRGAAVDRRLLEAGAAHTLDLAAVEVASAFRRMVRTGDMEAARAEEALGDLVVAPLRWHPATPLTARMWDLRHSHSPFDAAYLALAEVLDMPLVTTDGRLARSRGHSATVLDLSG